MKGFVKLAPEKKWQRDWENVLYVVRDAERIS